MKLDAVSKSLRVLCLVILALCLFSLPAQAGKKRSAESSSESSSASQSPRSHKGGKREDFGMREIQTSFGVLTQFPGRDITELPTQIARYSPRQTLTFGDLHGNALKLLHFLVSTSILTLDPDQKEAETLYGKLFQIYNYSRIFQASPAHTDLFRFRSGIHTSLETLYQTASKQYLFSEITQTRSLLESVTAKLSPGYIDLQDPGDLDILEEWREILEHATIQPHGPSLVLIGDEFADRGSNDFYTLLILHKLHQAQYPFEILLSNHALDFIQLVEGMHTGMFSTPNGSPRYSLENLKHLLESSDIVLKEEFLSMSDEYISHLNLMSFSMPADQDTFTFKTHAPVGLEVLPALAAQFNVNCSRWMEHPQALKNCIVRLNHHFHQELRPNFQIAALGLRQDGPMFRLTHYRPPTSETLTNRHPSFSAPPEMPTHIGNKRLFFLNGHHPLPNPSEQSVRISLDDLFGKMPPETDVSAFDLSEKDLVFQYFIEGL